MNGCVWVGVGMGKLAEWEWWVWVGGSCERACLQQLCGRRWQGVACMSHGGSCVYVPLSCWISLAAVDDHDWLVCLNFIGTAIRVLFFIVCCDFLFSLFLFFSFVLFVYSSRPCFFSFRVVLFSFYLWLYNRFILSFPLFFFYLFFLFFLSCSVCLILCSSFFFFLFLFFFLLFVLLLFPFITFLSFLFISYFFAY